jgi:putative DNA primase/helicase
MRDRTLHRIVHAVGGDLYDHGRRANIPAPGHSPADRSVSLWLTNGRLVVHTFGDGDWRTVMDELRRLRLVDGAGGGCSDEPEPTSRRAAVDLSTRERQAVAARLWETGRAVDGTPSERHLRLRAVTRDLPGAWALRHGQEVAVAAYREAGYRRPALLAGLHNPGGALTAVEITYLAPNGRRADDLRLPRKTIGVVPPGCAVRLDHAAEEMLVGEGVVTTLSAAERFSLPAWALTSTRNLRAWPPPPGVRSVLIAADRGTDGEASAERLRRRLVAIGLRVWVELPPAGCGDWNDWAAGRRAAAGAGAREAEGRDGAGAPTGRMVLVRGAGARS